MTNKEKRKGNGHRAREGSDMMSLSRQRNLINGKGRLNDQELLVNIEKDANRVGIRRKVRIKRVRISK